MKIKNTITRTMGKITLGLKRHSPEILMVTGIIGVVASTVIACKATLKVNDILDNAKLEVEKIHECAARTDLVDEYSEQDKKKDLAIVYVQTGVKLAKLYAPAVILGALSITSIVSSNHILHKRNIALATAYAAVDKGYKEYKSRVVERFGEEVDKELTYGTKTEKITETTTDEDGREITIEKEIKAVGNIASPYTRIFDEYNPNWEKDSEYNYMWLECQQAYFNDLLKARGYIFLNEVYDRLGFTKTKSGQIVGWVYDEKNPTGDNYIDFGLNNKNAVDFLNGYEYSVWLDFNVDGNILDKIREEEFYE